MGWRWHLHSGKSTHSRQHFHISLTVGCRSSMVEQGIVYPQVAGSSPVGTAKSRGNGRPTHPHHHTFTPTPILPGLLHCIALSFNGRTSDYESEDRGSSPCEATKRLNAGCHIRLPQHTHTFTPSHPHPILLLLANWLSLRTFYADIAGSNPVGSAHL